MSQYVLLRIQSLQEELESLKKSLNGSTNIFKQKKACIAAGFLFEFRMPMFG